MNVVQTLGKMKNKATLFTGTVLASSTLMLPTINAAGFETSAKQSGGQIYGLAALIALIVGSISLVIGLVMYNSGSAEGMQVGKKRIMSALLGIGGVLLAAVAIGWVYNMAVQSGGTTNLRMPW